MSTSRGCQTRIHSLANAIAAALLSGSAMAAPNVEFDARFLQGSMGDQLDLSRFERGEQLPGIYNVDIKVNGNVVARREVELREMPDRHVALCLSPEVVESLGVDRKRLRQPEEAGADRAAVQAPLPVDLFCDDLGQFIPQATTSFDAGEQVLDVRIPQAFLLRDPRGWVSPELWDRGVTAARLSYSISHQRLRGAGQSRQSSSAVLNTGLNLGGWRFRHDGYLSQRSGAGTGYHVGRTYAQHDIPRWGMAFTAGESSTQGDLFEGVNFRGASVGTDPRMLPDSQREYAPIVRGVAQTNAQVIIRQRDYILYQTNVSAGPFEINDLYGTAYAGDLDVQVIESDGRVQQFTVPFAAVPQLLRDGQQRVTATVGQLSDRWVRKEPLFAEATIRQGLSNQFTAYGGVTASSGYGAIVLGGAFNTSFGAIASDVSVARADLGTNTPGYGRRMQGTSYRVNFSKNIESTDTNIAMAAYRYSTDGYLTLNESVRLRHDLKDGQGGDALARQRTRLDLTVNQRLGKTGGSLYANGSSFSYWNLRERRTNFAIGYSNEVGSASYSLSVQRSRQRNLFGNSAARETDSVNFNLSMPLGRAPSSPRFTGTAARGDDGRQDLRVGITNTFGQQHQGSYTASLSQNGHQSANFDGNVAYQGSAASLSAGYSQSGNRRGVSLGASGGVLWHEGGLTLAQQLGDTVGVVHVPNAAGAGISSSVGVKTDARGYAVVPYLQPYRRNDVTVDPKGLPLDVELKTSSVLAVPTAGAVVRLTVPTDSGRSALIEARQLDGTPLPFGVDVYNEAGDVVGVVGQSSRLWVRGIDEAGVLIVRLGRDPLQRCEIPYDLAQADANGLISAGCRQIEAAP